MTDAKGYPLEALRRLRAGEEDSAARALAAAVRAHDEAVDATARAQAAQENHVRETRDLVERERSRPAAGLRPSDATALAAWRQRRRVELDGLTADVLRAREEEQQRAEAADAAREALANARRERDALEKHFARWRDAELRKAEARAEAETEDRRTRQGPLQR